MAAIELDHVNAGYGQNQVLHDLSMDVEPGRVNCIIGPNGSGKSTAMKTINGLVPVWDGRVSILGEDVTDAESYEIVDRGVVTVPQGGGVFQEMTVTENLRMGAYRLDDTDLEERYETVYEMFPVLSERGDQRAGSMSGGQQAMLAMGRALMADPEFLLLDEPSAGLAPNLIDDVFELIAQLKDAGLNMLIIEQNVRKVMDIAEYIYLIDQGSVAFAGETESLTDEDELVELYLGRRSK